MNLPERGSVSRRTWGCSDALRLTEPRSHRVVRFHGPQCASKFWRSGLPMNQPLPVSWPDRSSGPRPVPGPARGPRQHSWKITHALVFERPLRAGTARGPNLIRFMVPMRARKSVGALHEPERRTPVRHPSARPERADLEIGAPGALFMVPRRGKRACRLSMSRSSRLGFPDPLKENRLPLKMLEPKPRDNKVVVT